jgi:hypothetical protein
VCPRVRVVDESGFAAEALGGAGEEVDDVEEVGNVGEELGDLCEHGEAPIGVVNNGHSSKELLTEQLLPKNRDYAAPHTVG